MKLDLNEIDNIVNKGVRPKKTFVKYLREAVRELGMHNIFHDVAQLIVIIILSILIIGFVLAYIDTSNEVKVFKAIFMLSPLIYVISSMFTFINSREKKVFDIEMTCKYNLYQISAIRMFIFSILAIVINTTIILGSFISNNDISLMKLICLSITSVFIFSSILLFALVSIKNRILRKVILGGWIVINVVLFKLDISIYNYMLVNVPIYIHIIITLLCIWTYIRNLNKLINFRRRGGAI